MKCLDCPEYEICNLKYDLRTARAHCKMSHCNKTRKKKHTNADKIRSMTDEELAVFLDEFSARCVDCIELGRNKDCPIYNQGIFCEPCDIVEWLKQPVEEEPEATMEKMKEDK